MHLSHSNLRPTHWCQYCDCALLADEVVEVALPADQGCPGATDLVLDTCCVCGNDVEFYNYQDELEVCED